MNTLTNLVSAFSLVISVGAAGRLVLLFIQMAFDTDDKSAYKNEIKHVLVVLIISVLVAGTSITALVNDYFR